MKRVFLAAAMCLLTTGLARGEQACATSAGCPKCPSCGKACKVVCEMKKVTKTVWVVECEEFCPSLPGCPWDCKSCPAGCKDGACQSGECASLRKPMVPPQCCGVKTTKKLVKKEIECEVPVYKCVVACQCGARGRDCGDAAPVKAAAPVPAAKQAPLPPKAAMGQ